MGHASSEFSEDLEFLRAGELVAEGFPVAPERGLVQGPSHGGRQSGEAVFQDVVGRAVLKGSHRCFFADDARNNEKRHIGLQLPGEPKRFHSIGAGQREISQNKIDAPAFEFLQKSRLRFHPVDLAIQAIRFQPAQDQLGIERIVLQMKNPALHLCGRSERAGGVFRPVQKWPMA